MNDRPQFTVTITDESFDIDVGVNLEWGFILHEWADKELTEEQAIDKCGEILSGMVYFRGSQLTWRDDPDIEVVEVR